MLFVFLLTKNNTTLSQGQRRYDVMLTSLVEHDKVLSKFGEQQLVMVNYERGFNQSQARKCFERIKMLFMIYF